MLGPPPPPQPPGHWWQGASGRWYYFSIYPITAIPSWIGECNYIFARPRYDIAQSREPFYIGEKGDTDRFLRHEKLDPALQLGATELHLHLLAKSRRERLDIETDLRNSHITPLNRQLGVAATHGGILGGMTSPFNFGAPSGIGALARALGIVPEPQPVPRNALTALSAPQAGFGALGIAATDDIFNPFGFGGLAAAASGGISPEPPSYRNPLTFLPASKPNSLYPEGAMVTAAETLLGTKKDIRHKNFISFYHDDDEAYRIAFETAFGSFFIDKSVAIGDIKTDNSSDYVKRLIAEDYITDASVVTVLVGPNTKKRKHVDWEIAAGLNKKVGGYSGLIGILLPTFPWAPDRKFHYDDLPPRLAVNVKSGYAAVYDWNTLNVANIKACIEQAFQRRKDKANLINNSLPLFSNNRA